MGLTITEFHTLIARDLKVTVDTEISTAELTRSVERAVDDLSRLFPLELVHEETLDFTVTDESFTTPAAASATAIVNAVSISGESDGATLSIVDLTPDVPRRLTVTLTDANNSVSKLTLILKGTDSNGNYVEERHYLTDLVPGTAIQGNIYFKRMAQVELDAIAGATAADKISVGTGNAYDSVIFLANKPIKPKSETVTNAAGTTTYTRDTDYTIDWTNGAIKFITDGDMEAGTAYLISYTKSRLGVNISSLLPIVTKISKVQYPVNEIPQQFVSYNIVGDFMFVASQVAGQSQTELADKAHIAIWYERRQMPPSEHSPGSYPDILDEVIAIGAAGYALLTEAQQYEQAAATALTALDTALTSAKKYLDNNGDADEAGILADITTDAAALRTAITTAVDAANTYLDEVDTTDLGAGDPDSAEAALKKYEDGIDSLRTGARVGELGHEYSGAWTRIAGARTNAALGYIQEASIRLGNLRTYIEQAGQYDRLASQFMSEARMRAESVNGNLVLSDRFRTEGLSRLNEFHSILRNKAEARRRTSSVSTKQPA